MKTRTRIGFALTFSHVFLLLRGPVRIAVICLCFLLAAGMPAQQPGIAGVGDNSKPAFITFEAPGAGTGAGQGTYASSINRAGAITGDYRDASGTFHGFVRAADGTITDFDVPGSTGTSPSSINAVGVIAGSYGDASNVSHGFVRAADGTITTFDAPGAGTGAYEGTSPISMNTAGAITGFYSDASLTDRSEERRVG